MEPRTRLIEVKTAEGKLILSFVITEKPVMNENRSAPPENPRNDNKREPQRANNSGNGEAAMTDAQKRYLFRILADQGIDGDGAYEQLKKLFGTASLKEVSKFEASKMIERLLGETKGAVYD